MTSSIYVHVPFCASRCAYCSFYSTVGCDAQKSAYIRAVKAESEHRAYEAQGKTVETIYFGGGTPSQLALGDIEELLENFRKNYNVLPNAEVTLEANPDDITPEFATGLHRIGINRVSMGVQSFNDAVLSYINRRHHAKQAIEAVETLRKSDISNISIDLIYGLPGQDITQFEKDIDTAISLPINHLSSYALSIEEGTPLYRLKAQGNITEMPEDDFLTMYTILCNRLQSAGFDHYEISNFCRPGYESRHNNGYWCGRQYIGLGPGAHSYDGIRTRRSNNCQLQQYCDFWTAVNPDEAAAPFEVERLTDGELYDEKIMTRLRRREGLLLNELQQGEQRYLLHAAQPFIDNGQLQFDGERLQLTRKGIFISDAIMAELMWEE